MNHYTPFTQILMILARHGVRPLNVLTPVLLRFLAAWPFVSLFLFYIGMIGGHGRAAVSGTKLRLSVAKLTPQCSK